MKRGELVALPGRGRRGFVRHSLWLGSDHLLSVEDLFVKQRYRRFALTDIQLVRVRPTRLQTLRLVLLSPVMTAAFGFALALPGGALRAGSFTLGGLLALAVSRELLLGPTCTTTLYTSVSSVALPSLGRLRSAERALATLALAVTRTQGKLGPDRAGAGALSTNLLQHAPAERSAVPSLQRRAERRTWGLLLCGVAWLGAVLNSILLGAGGQQLAALVIAAVLATFVVAIGAAATTRAGRMRAAALSGVAAGVLGLSGLWLIELVGRLRGGTALEQSSFALLSAGPLEREPLPWVVLGAILLGVVMAGTQAGRALLGRSS